VCVCVCVCCVVCVCVVCVCVRGLSIGVVCDLLIEKNARPRECVAPIFFVGNGLDKLVLEG